MTMRQRRYRYDDIEWGDKVQGGTNRDDKKEIERKRERMKEKESHHCTRGCWLGDEQEGKSRGMDGCLGYSS